jgi:formylglycine-generating enzyme required for sulfatase activity/tRNA A-37 threonylcarbamoyl transferase component Bud32
MPQTGSILKSRYRVVRAIKRGAMGAVYEAYDETLKLRVAVKQTIADTEPLRNALAREALFLARLKHPHLPRVIDHFEDDGDYYLAMDFIDGKDLGALVAEADLPVDRVLRWARQLLDVVEYLHGYAHDGEPKPIVHCDIKPLNIKPDARDDIFLLDFGLASGLPTDLVGSHLHTVPGGTGGYAPIEQQVRDGSDEPEPRWDIYAIGATLYHLLVGEVPVNAAKRSMRMFTKNGEDPFTPAHVKKPEKVSVALSEVVSRALAFNAEDRFATIGEFRAALQAAVPSRSDRTTQRLKRVEAHLDLLYEKLAAFERELAIAADPGKQFELRERIKEIRGEIAEYEKEGAQLAPPVVTRIVPAPPVIVPAPAIVIPQLAPSLRNSIGMEFVLVPAGKFMMGSNAYDSEKPIHEVTISAAFYMGKYQVTQGEWTAVMGNNPSRFKGDDRLPVETVSWNDCQKFITRLNARQDGYVYRLPSEAEWEYACRAGTTGEYAGELDEMAWYWENSGSKTHPVGEKNANAWGLHDMHGNVWEWCQDGWHENYNGAPTDGRARETGSDNFRILRGGSWNFVANYCRSALRNYVTPALRSNGYGFRLVAARIP